MKSPHPANEASATLRLRREVAAVTLLLNDLDILGYSGHVGARLPDGETFLIQAVDQSRASLGPDDLLICGLDGKLVAGPNGLKPPSELFIHSEIFRARPDVNAVAHFHHDLATTFTLVAGATLVPIKNHAVRWASGIPTHPDPSHVSSPALGQALARTLGSHHAALIRAHGQVVAAEDLRALLIDCVHFVENAEALYRARMLGPVVPLTPGEMESFLVDFDRERHVAKLWKYYAGRGRDQGLLPDEWGLV
jgi:ribulose-5-phosphate 4-epimerase/fuculose-1-phosphate aldolase